MPRACDEIEPLAKTTVDPSVDADVPCEARKVWLAENQPAIDAYNEQVAQHGVFADTLWLVAAITTPIYTQS